MVDIKFHYRNSYESTLPLREVELSCLGVPAAPGGGQYVFLGTGTHELRSPSLRCDNSRMNLPSVKMRMKRILKLQQKSVILNPSSGYFPYHLTLPQ